MRMPHLSRARPSDTRREGWPFSVTPRRGPSPARVAQRLRRNRLMADLRAIDLFSDCSKTELRRIAALTTEHSAQPGQVLVRQGEPGEEFFVIIQGRAAVIRNDTYLAVRGPGSFVGELALLDRGKRSASVVAETKMRLLVMSVREFNSLRHVAPSVSPKMLLELGSSLRRSDAMLDGLH